MGITAVLAGMAALAIVPSAFAHHGRISGGIDCQGVVTYTASAWQTTSVLAKTHNDVRVYVIQANGAAVTPQQVGTGQFNSANGFGFSGTFTVPFGVNSVRLLVKEIGPWGNGQASSNGTNAESSTTVTRPVSGCAPPPPQCPAAANAKLTSSSEIGIAGGTATVSFTIAAGCENIKLSLVSYKAPGPAFDANTADQQTVHDFKTVVLGAGNQTLTVAMPSCYYQVDFVYGDVITKFGPAGSSNFYSAQGRLIKARNGGTSSCTPPPVDECPNIAGNQATVPVGMSKDANGGCVTPPPPPPTDTTPPVESTPATIAAVTATVVPSPAAAKPAAKPAPKAKVKVKKKAKLKKKVVTKKKKKVTVKQQPTAKKAKPGALPFTP
ncbi:MAG TPA: hypothetical protein VIE18_03655 [Gaiellaceae bacterium]